MTDPGSALAANVQAMAIEMAGMRAELSHLTDLIEKRSDDHDRLVKLETQSRQMRTEIREIRQAREAQPAEGSAGKLMPAATGSGAAVGVFGIIELIRWALATGATP